MRQCLVEELGGLPMIDDTVNASAVMTLACAVRRQLDQERQALAAYMQPELACECYRNAATTPVTELESKDLSEEGLLSIQAACAEIVTLVPEWRAYFSLPIRWRQLVSDMSSSSNPLIPQTIFLGARGLCSPRLAELIVHEVSHTWVGMIAEVVPLALRGPAIHVLPSGTPDKEIAQVMYALTFAGTAVRFYRRRVELVQHSEDEHERLAWLENYTAGCLEIVEASELLLPDGASMAKSCRRLLNS